MAGAATGFAEPPRPFRACHPPANSRNLLFAEPQVLRLRPRRRHTRLAVHVLTTLRWPGPRLRPGPATGRKSSVPIATAWPSMNRWPPSGRPADYSPFGSARWAADLPACRWPARAWCCSIAWATRRLSRAWTPPWANRSGRPRSPRITSPRSPTTTGRGPRRLSPAAAFMSTVPWAGCAAWKRPRARCCGNATRSPISTRSGPSTASRPKVISAPAAHRWSRATRSSSTWAETPLGRASWPSPPRAAKRCGLPRTNGPVTRRRWP